MRQERTEGRRLALGLGDLRLSHVVVTPDRGAVFEGLNIDGLRIDALGSKKNLGGEPLIRLKNTRNAYIGGTFLPPGKETYLELSGKKCASIALDADDVRLYSDRILWKDGADKRALR